MTEVITKEEWEARAWYYEEPEQKTEEEKEADRAWALCQEDKNIN